MGGFGCRETRGESVRNRGGIEGERRWESRWELGWEWGGKKGGVVWVRVVSRGEGAEQSRKENRPGVQDVWTVQVEQFE